MRDVAIVGLPYSGKSTVFNAVARAHASVGGGAKRANVAVVTVPDPRVAELTRIYASRKTTHAQVRLVDAAGLDAGSLAAAREADALAVVLRGFGDDADPVRDLGRLRAELAVADLQTIERAQERAAKQARSGDASKRAEAELYARAEAVLSEDRWLADEPWEAEEARTLKLLTPLTMKPALHVVNLDETHDEATFAVPDPAMTIRGLLEAEAAELDPDDAASLLAEFGVTESATSRFVRSVYELLDLVTFFTAGEPESIARAIPRGTSARGAAGAIHSDLERGFIRAEVVSYDDLVEAGSLDAARERGRLRVEGRDYVVQEGDVILVRFSV